MMITRNSMAFIATVVVAAMALAAAYLATHLAPGTRLPVHWNYRGNADAFSSAWTALLLPLLVTVPTSILFYMLPGIEPRADNLGRSRGIYLALWASLLLLGLFYQVAVVATALHWQVQTADFILAGVGLLFVLVGNQLGKSRSMKRIGLRTRWTLASENVWVRTHRLSGKLMVAGGLLVALSAIAQMSVTISLVLLLATTLLAILLPAGLSFAFFRAEERPGV
ncbi:MAG TPA: SdpI family protein [Sphingomicrobium sp.]|nr:SdpI family protein [Sphingomicrobium sp.]